MWKHVYKHVSIFDSHIEELNMLKIYGHFDIWVLLAPYPRLESQQLHWPSNAEYLGIYIDTSGKLKFKNNYDIWSDHVKKGIGNIVALLKSDASYSFFYQ